MRGGVQKATTPVGAIARIINKCVDNFSDWWVRELAVQKRRIWKILTIILVKFVWWWAGEKPILPTLRSLTVPTLFFGGFIMCILSVYGQLQYPELIATIGVIAFGVGAWVILPPVERNKI